MSLPTYFTTLQDTSIGEFKDKGSKFIAYAFPAKTEEECKQRIKLLHKEHHAAAHVCWAYVLGLSGDTEKSSDDREPAGSAGRPILQVLQSNQLTFVCIAVVRYFGGKLLGVPGLINAYNNAAKDAITKAVLVKKEIFYRIFVAADFELHHEIIRICKQNQLKFFPDMQNQMQGITFDVPPSKKEPVLAVLLTKNFTNYHDLGILYE